MVVHQLCASDDSGLCHDHRWRFLTIVLRGGYLEYGPDGTYVRRRAGSMALRPATALHRVELLTSQTWTILVRGRQTRDWGVLTESGWVAADETDVAERFEPELAPVSPDLGI